MKRILILAALFALVGTTGLFAQSATLSTPQTQPTITKVVATRVEIIRDCACAAVHIAYQDASSNDATKTRFDIPADPANPGTELQTFIGALLTARSGETGVNSRKLNFRALGYLVDSGRLTGVTLVP